MAFAFGAPAPAPAAGGFAFGAPAPAAAAPAAAPLFGAPAPAAPAASSGGLFGATPAPAPAAGGLFGATKAAAPATGGGLFGSTAPAAATTTTTTGGGLFGSTTTPAPAGGGLFGSAAPAPATVGLFGSTPAPAPGGFFGTTPAPAPAVGGLFGAPVAASPAMQQQHQQQQRLQQPLSGNTPYAQLPDNAKRAIDQIYQLMMQHRRTLASVKTMAPSLLATDDYGGAVVAGGEKPSPADAAAGSPRRRAPSNAAALPRQTNALRAQIQSLSQSAETNLGEARRLKDRAGEATARAKMHGAWPVENVAARRGVALSSVRGSTGGAAPGGAVTGAGGASASCSNVSGMANADAVALQRIMDIRATHVDRIELMPSPYFWEVLRDFEERASVVHGDVEAVRARLAIAEEAERVQSAGGGGGIGGRGAIRADEASLLLTNRRGENLDVMTSLVMSEGSLAASAPLPRRLATLARSQNDLFLRIAARAASAHDGLEDAKLRYRNYCRMTNHGAGRGGYYEDPFLRADVEEVAREREVQRRIMEERIATAEPTAMAQAVAAVPGAAAPAGGGLFGQAAPAPATAGMFGAPAPAPAAGGLFGAPAPAPSAGGLFGATAAPAPSGGLFGSTTPAPATGGGLFGAAAPAPAAGGGLFGSAAPAPSGNLAGLFGSPAPAPTGNLFGAAPTTPASTLAPRKKSGSRSGGRRR